MSDVVVVDLGMGNLRSVARALERAGATVRVSSVPEDVARAPRLVVPGQGHFADCARAMAGPLGLACREQIASGRPYLGLCLGMQVLFEESDEAPGARGLGLFAGRVVRFEAGRDEVPGVPRKIPHMGWNIVRAREGAPLLEPEAWFYFVHSYHCVPADPSVVAGMTDFGEPVCAVVTRDNVVGCQFHPEKSHAAGARLLARFVGAAT
ncbi:MAG: imidazole glycerol phosphate synthase subunit HisH [Sandaracinaceae bacterium]